MAPDPTTLPLLPPSGRSVLLKFIAQVRRPADPARTSDMPHDARSVSAAANCTAPRPNPPFSGLRKSL